MTRIQPVNPNTADPATVELLGSVKKTMEPGPNIIADSDFTPASAIDDRPGPTIQPDRRAILDKMHDLTEKQRAVLRAALKGMPQNEITRYLGSNRKAVCKLTHDARKRLQQYLESAGYEADDINAAFT